MKVALEAQEALEGLLGLQGLLGLHPGRASKLALETRGLEDLWGLLGLQSLLGRLFLPSNLKVAPDARGGPGGPPGLQGLLGLRPWNVLGWPRS